MKLCASAWLVMSLSIGSAAMADESVDLEVVHRIKQEAFYHSKVMDYLHVIADANGPRMSGSPGFRHAAEQAVAAYTEAGIDAELEPWGVLGRGWDWSRVAVQMKRPQVSTLVAYPADFSPATDGPVRGEVVFAPLWPHKGDAPEDGDLEKIASRIEAWQAEYKGKLAGKVVMLDHPSEFKLVEEPKAPRFSDEDLTDLSSESYNGALEPGPVPALTWPLIRYPVDKDEASRVWEVIPLEFAIDRWQLQQKLRGRMAAFLASGGVKAVLANGWSPSPGIIMHSDFGSSAAEDPLFPPSVVLMPEQYQRLHRLIDRGVAVELEVDIDAHLYPNAEGVNVIAEIEGAHRSGEVVMLGAHLDSWHGATGATDNGAGSAVVMEAMRILKSLSLPMRRTVRAALWDGEEFGMLGSRAYVTKHFADPLTMHLKPEHAKLSAYFNMDNGGGRIRGVYLQQNDMARPILDAWLAPFADLGVSNAPIINTYGTDHLSFNAVGLPGFSFVQDPLIYDSHTHHSNVDDVSHIIPGDLMQAAAVMAATVYQAATRPALMPRKQLPDKLPERGPLPAILQ